MHAVALLADWYEPATQDVQLLCPLVAAASPGLHAVGALARSKQWLPAGQVTHAVAPLADWYVPATHAAQTLCRSPAAIVPGSQAVAAMLPVAHAEPAGHAEQSA